MFECLYYRKCFWQNCTYNEKDLQSIGKVDVVVNGKTFLQLKGDVEFGEFGTSISVGDPLGNKDYVLAVGSPGKSERKIHNLFISQI